MIAEKVERWNSWTVEYYTKVAALVTVFDY